MASVSIIIISLNEEHYIGHILGDIAQQYDPTVITEVLVVDGGSTDKTEQVVTSFRAKLPIRFITAPRRGYATQKNHGVSQAKGSILLFMDADLRIGPDLISKMLEAHRKHPSMILAAKMYADSPKLKYKIGAQLTDGYFRLQKLIGLPVAADQCTILNKQIWQKLGGMDNDIPHAEMLELMQRAAKHGHKSGWAPGAKAYASMRRFEEKGGGKLFIKYVRSEIHRHANKGRVKKDYIGYTKDNPRQP